MSLKIVLVDDEVVQHQVMQSLITNHPLVSEFLTYTSANKLLFDLEDLVDIDAFFLDVEMPEMNGLALAKALRQRDIETPIVFMTAYAEFALESYEVNAFDYLLKPIKQEKLFKLVDRIASIQPTLEPTIFFDVDGLQKVYLKDIYALEAQGHHTKVIFATEDYLVKESISAIRERLNDHFVMSHRSYVINLNHVRQVQSEDVILENDIRIPLSRRMVKSFSEAFVSFYQRGDFSL